MNRVGKNGKTLFENIMNKAGRNDPNIRGDVLYRTPEGKLDWTPAAYASGKLKENATGKTVYGPAGSANRYSNAAAAAEPAPIERPMRYKTSRYSSRYRVFTPLMSDKGKLG